MNFKQKLVYTALGGILIFIGLLLSHTFGGDVKAQWQQDDPPANITVSEYLNLFFQLHLGKINGFNHPRGFELIKLHVTFFALGDVSQGMVYMIIPWSDEYVSQSEIRYAIRMETNLAVRRFESLLLWPMVRSRFSPSQPRSHLVIRHVRSGALQKTLAVTLDGETSFQAAEFWEAKRRVESSGGNWSFLK